MPDAPLRRCLGTPGQRCGVLTRQPRCPEHARQHERNRKAHRTYTAAERERRAQAVAQWRAEHGDWCPGSEWCGPEHESIDLTADHIDAVGAGGPEGGPLRVLCRSANSARGKRAS